MPHAAPVYCLLFTVHAGPLYLPVSMTPDEFRAHGHRLVDWMADYLHDVGRRRVVPELQPGEIRRSLPALPPDNAEPFDRILADFEQLIMPGMTHWNHPGWFAYFAANNSPPSI